jgi:hypothetical protein
MQIRPIAVALVAVVILFLLLCTNIQVNADHEDRPESPVPELAPTATPTPSGMWLSTEPDPPFEFELIGAPHSPVLLSPAPNHVLQSPSVTFTWEPREGGPAAAYFELCITEVDKPCSHPSAVNYTNIPTTTVSYTPPDGLPLRFQGKALRWTSSVCSPALLQWLHGDTVYICNTAHLRPLLWQLPAPELRRADGPVQILRPNFSWSRVVGADSYLLCVSKPGVTCPTQPVNNTNTVVVARLSGFYTPPPDQALVQFAGQTVHWTAAACNATFGCVYQTQIKQITFPAIPPLPEPPNLQTPASGHETDSRRQIFTWQAVQGATSYKLCISPPGVQCDTPGSYATAGIGVTRYTLDIPQWIGPIGTELNWTVASCNGFHPCVYQQQVRPLVIGPLPSLSLFPGSTSLPVGSGQSVTLQLPAALTETLDVTVTPNNANIAVHGATAGMPAVVTIPSNNRSDTFQIQAVQAGQSTIIASATGYRSASTQVHVPSPHIDLSLSNSHIITVEWGNTVSVVVTVEGKNGFSGAVDLTLENVPFGVTPSFAPSRLNVPQNGTATSALSLSTVAGGTMLAPPPLRVRATPQAGGVASKTASFTLDVWRTGGDFRQVTLRTNDSSCGSVTAAVVAPGPNAPHSGPHVRFSAPPFNRTYPQAALPFSEGYAVSPRCRIGIIIPPVVREQHHTALWNLGFDPAIGGGSPLGHQIMTGIPGVFTNGYFSQDDSLFVLVTPTGGVGTTHVAAASLYDLARGTKIGESKSFTGRVNSVVLDGNIVSLNTNPPFSTPEASGWTVP